MSTLHPTLGPSRHRNVALLGILVGLLPTTTFAALAGWHYVAFPVVGQADDQLFGVAIADAGDVNGDGYTDALVGAPGQNNDRTYVGRAYLFFGGPNADATPDVTFHGSLPGDKFGRSVAGAGDVNGDGYADIIIGAPYDGTGGVYAGRWCLYFGGPAVDNTADLVRNGIASGRLGFSVASAGDVNNDGFDDVIVGQPGKNRALIYLGAAAMNSFADVVLSYDDLGQNVAGVGDVNGDGYDDVVALAQSEVVLYFGGAPMNDTADLMYDFGGLPPYFDVAGAGDVNHDGFADIIVSVIKPYVLSNAYIYHGGAAVNLIPDVILSEGAATDWFGMSVAKGGNLNGDAYSDVLVGSSIGNSDTVFAYNGGNPMNATKDRSFPGRYVSGLARWNGDSRSDFMIGGGGIVTIYYSKYFGPFPSSTP